VSLYPCSSCGQRQKGRLATFYNAWFDEQGERVCYRQRLCVPCVMLLREILSGTQCENSSAVACCPMCGSDSSANQSAIYLTVYLPKQEAREYALTTCTSCAMNLHESLQVGAQLMADRPGGEAGAPASSSSAWSEVLP
jgi:hypothetical protein